MSGDIEGMQAVLRRLDITERNTSDLAGSVGRLAQQMIESSERVDMLERAHYDTREFRAAQVEREKTLQRDISAILKKMGQFEDLNLGTVKSDVSSLKGANSRMFWLVAGTIIAGFGALAFTFLTRGVVGV